MANRDFNTRELDAILAESRSRKAGSSASARNTGASRQPVNTRSAGAPVRRQPASNARGFSDDFIVTDEYNRPISRSAASRPASGYQQRPTPADKPAPVKKKKKKTALIVTLCIIGIILIAAVGAVTLYLNSGSGTGPESTFSDNVYLNGKPLMDLTMEDARTVAKGIEDELAAGIKIDVKVGDKSYHYTKDDFKYTFDTETILSQAKAYSEEKGIKTEEQNYEITMKVEDTTCQDIVTKIAGEVKTDAKDAEVTDFDPSADSMFTITPESKGTTLDQEAGLSTLKKFINDGNISGSVDFTVTEVDPEYTADYLKENITKLSSFSTISTNNSNGNENMRVSLAACNGSIIEPGATWSFNDCTGNSNLESNGYKPAGVIVEGRSETGVGGGICQSSTTIYNACILCGMTVAERECHYYKSVYVDAGRDATVDYGNIDLKMTNPFKYQLFMKCWMDGTELNCEIYGLENPKFDDIEISTTSPEYFGNGYKVYTTRTYLKNGEEVDSDDLPSSTYYTSAPSSGSSGYSSDDSGDYSGSDDDDSGNSGGEETPPEEPAPEPPPAENPEVVEGGE